MIREMIRPERRRAVLVYLTESELRRLETARRGLERQWRRPVSRSAMARAGIMRSLHELETARD